MTTVGRKSLSDKLQTNLTVIANQRIPIAGRLVLIRVGKHAKGKQPKRDK